MKWHRREINDRGCQQKRGTPQPQQFMACCDVLHEERGGFLCNILIVNNLGEIIEMGIWKRGLERWEVRRGVMGSEGEWRVGRY